MKMFELQIVFEGMWGSSRGTGFMAVDDVTFYKGDCSSKFIFRKLNSNFFRELRYCLYLLTVIDMSMSGYTKISFLFWSLPSTYILFD